MAKMVREVMSKGVKTINQDAFVAEAVRTMDTHRFRHLPVVDASGKIVGMLSDRDFMQVSDFDLTKVVQVMSRSVLTISESGTLLECANIILQKKISSLLVVDSSEKPVGIITTDDLIKELAQRLEGS